MQSIETEDIGPVLCDVNGKECNVLRRIDFLSVENQRCVIHDYYPTPRVKQAFDLHFEDSKLSMEQGKLVQLARRDFLFADNYDTRGNVFVFEIVHLRSFIKYHCATNPGGLLETLACLKEACNKTGICHEAGAVIDAHHLNRYVLRKNIYKTR